ncbi:MAG: DUF2058 domain-containing protein [Gammaproteobacteria bacterium]|uniref:DUF2058 domain-containing protein n=1 Tax=Methylotuvimicrobium sp. TaxID=2822413 RepID=UPI001D85960C|nr:DUF2058 domain-containing protein [Gammaproteobacteria bacterium]
MSQKKLSLQEQLLKSGLASDTKAKQIRAEKRKQPKKNAHAAAEQTRLEIQKAKTEQQEKDRLLNQLKKEETERKQLAAQIKQLIEQHKFAQSNDGVKYNFNDNGKVKSVYVSEFVRNQIVNGRAAIVICEKQYQIVPLEIAQKIEQRLPGVIVLINEPPKQPEADDPYADYQIPDDLIW